MMTVLALLTMIGFAVYQLARGGTDHPGPTK